MMAAAGTQTRPWLVLTSGQQEVVKWAAVLLMVLDHLAVATLDGGAYVAARTAGRLAFPLFGFLIAYNLVGRGVPAWRYYWPLLVLLVVSQVPYAFFSTSGALNIFGELLAGVMLVDALDRRARFLVLVGLVVVVVSFVGGYGPAGVLLIPAWALLIRWPYLGCALALFVVLLGLNVGHVGMVVPLFALPLLEGVRRLPVKLDRMPRWLWYAFYPVHLVVLGAVRWL